jgi:hypothetical protein
VSAVIVQKYIAADWENPTFVFETPCAVVGTGCRNHFSIAASEVRSNDRNINERASAKLRFSFVAMERGFAPGSMCFK